MAADDLAMEGARASATLLLTVEQDELGPCM